MNPHFLIAFFPAENVLPPNAAPSLSLPIGPFALSGQSEISHILV